MKKQKQLTKKQVAFLEDLFSGHFDEQAALDKHKISSRIYQKWQGQELFKRELAARKEAAHRQSELIIARYASLAAAKLVQLTESENQETARKACLDIITHPASCSRRGKGDGGDQKGGEEGEGGEDISAEAAAKILEVLAEEKNSEK